MKQLFESTTLGPYTLRNRVVMAPMTRSRATGNVPNELLEQYYRLRANAGLIITEGTSPSPNGLGYARIPGIFNEAQVRGWKRVTDAVHAAHGKIFVQLMHTGRVGHPLNLPDGATLFGPSAIAVSGTMWTDSDGMQPHPVPIVMSEQDIANVVREFAVAAENAVEAGFDGVELHAANGYLLEQFLNPRSNQRVDRYGKDANGRMALLLEVATAAAKAIGSHRVGVRLSPYGVFNDTGAFDGIDPFYEQLTERLSELNLVYLHIVDHQSLGAPGPSPELSWSLRQRFRGTFILSGGYDRARAEQALAEDRGDLVAFGRPFLSNPDFVQKLQTGTELVAPDQSTFYTPGAAGYTEF
jgi:N-ethylmaleimide reductase